jgi:hypothetical protein
MGAKSPKHSPTCAFWIVYSSRTLIRGHAGRRFVDRMVWHEPLDSWNLKPRRSAKARRRGTRIGQVAMLWTDRLIPPYSAPPLASP